MTRLPVDATPNTLHYARVLPRAAHPIPLDHLLDCLALAVMLLPFLVALMAGVLYALLSLALP